MNSRFYKGIRFKITLIISMVFMVINLLFGLIIYHYLKKSYVENHYKYLFSRAKTILDKTEINPDVIALPDSSEAIRVFYHDNFKKPVQVFQSPGAISKLNVPYKTGAVDSLGMYGVYLKKEDFDGRPVELLLSVSSIPLKSKLNQFSMLMIFATAVSLVISSIFAFFASGWSLKPIRLIVAQASKINSNRLSERIEVRKTHDELQQLTETINTMLDRIEQEQQAQNNFFAAASHELRTPLANLRAQTEVEIGNRTSLQDKELLQSQLQEISRLQDIVEQFLLLSQIKHAKITLRKMPTDVAEQLLRVFSRNQYLAKKRNISHQIIFDEEMASFDLNIDAEKMEIVWQNLIQNAQKHAHAASSLICKVTEFPQVIGISFENSIAEESINIDGLAQAFTASRSLTSGSGLGLWLCKQLIEAHHGSMKIESGNYYFSVSVFLPKAGN